MKLNFKLMINYKKDGRLNSATISLNKNVINHLETNSLSLFYKNKEIILTNETESETYEKLRNGKIVELKKNIKLQSGRKVIIPLTILDDFGVNLEKENRVTVDLLEDHKVKIKLIPFEEEIEVSEKEENKKMGKILTVKVNKGGIGKTFTTVQLGSYLALKNKKVLLLTSDSQNNILDYCFGKKIEFSGGLKELVRGKNGEIIKLRENLFFIPLESSTFGTQFLLKLPIFLENLKKEYDYILIDSIPTMKIDSVFVKSSDKIIIPTFCDRVTTEGVLNVIEETGVNKVLAILINKYEDKKIQNLYKNELIEATKNTDILFPNSIPNTSEIEMLLHKGKTIWESKSKKILEIQISFKEIGDYLLENKQSEEFNIEF